MNLLSAYNRSSLLQKLSSHEFDLLVIGGGITGAGIALDAASRGFKTALVEKQDFAAGTSSRSTKLIHGGLRYLRQGEIALVREVSRERAIVYRNAPHLLVPEKILLPLIKNGDYGKFETSLGLWFYDMVAGVKKEERKKMLPIEQTLKSEPLLRKEILVGGCLFTEYRTDDARLTIEIIKTAVKYGAACINYCEVKDFIYENEVVSGVECDDLLSVDKNSSPAQNIFIIKAKQIINAAGPWVDKIRNNDTAHTLTPTRYSEQEKRLHLTKGVHLVVNHEKFPVKQAIYFPALTVGKDFANTRMIFAIPRGKATYIGTTDTDYNGSLENPVTNKQDADYLLNSVNYMFPAVKLSLPDVVSSWAGIRPLIHQKGKTPSEISRKDEIFISKSGLISIGGGKLTGYRKMAQRVVDIVNRNLHNSFGFPKVKCKTENIIINGGEIEEVTNYIQQVFEKINTYGLGHYQAEYLVRNYGLQCDFILEKFLELFNNQLSINNNQLIASRLDRDFAAAQLARAELWFTVNHESVFRLQDFFIRRTAMLYFDIQSMEKLLEPLLEDMKNYFGWTENESKSENVQIRKIIRNAIVFPN
ncbi:MAG: glycerol-3-phosphate dehydrogenase/oxidase [Cytophagales bacterium]|nr:glycerol-3-phosphate dehydrogenase/oxidase [Cytophagales bacterium]